MVITLPFLAVIAAGQTTCRFHTTTSFSDAAASWRPSGDQWELGIESLRRDIEQTGTAPIDGG